MEPPSSRDELPPNLQASADELTSVTYFQLDVVVQARVLHYAATWAAASITIATFYKELRSANDFYDQAARNYSPAKLEHRDQRTLYRYNLVELRDLLLKLYEHYQYLKQYLESNIPHHQNCVFNTVLPPGISFARDDVISYPR
jgi:hypothetical protein